MTRAILLSGLLLVLAAPLPAQQPGRGPGRMTFKVPDPILFNGPPTPEDFLDLVGLDSTQYNAYRVHYSAFMEQTRPQRDSLLEARREMRDAMAQAQMSGTPPDRPAGGGQLQKTMGVLEKRQKEFDEGLKSLLREPQVKRYESWRKEELARAERELRERYGMPP
jgi:hypothetical protein